ncbi:MAG: hypothetical protein KAW47_10330, partial [Thermoplasmatales archaeon]|nr:hypothetical protein [Thermoplasmatales archaeon]
SCNKYNRSILNYGEISSLLITLNVQLLQITIRVICFIHLIYSVDISKNPFIFNWATSIK